MPYVRIDPLHIGPYRVTLSGGVSLQSVPRSARIIRYTRGQGAVIEVPHGMVKRVGASVVFNSEGEEFTFPRACIRKVCKVLVRPQPAW